MKIFVIVFLLVLPASLNATQGNEWSLQRCIDHAMSHNIDIRKQVLLEEGARADLHRSYANLFPSVNASASQGFAFGRVIDPITNEFTTERRFSQIIGASSEVVLFSGFSNVNSLRANISRSTAVRYDTERMKNDIILSILGAYLQILYHEELLSVTREQLEVVGQQAHRTRILFEGGTIARHALLEVEAQQAQQQMQLVNVQNNLRLSYLELIQLLDLDPEQEFIVEGLRVELADQFLPRPAADAYQRALQVEPSVRAAELRVTMADRNLSAARGVYSPYIVMGAGLSTGYSEAADLSYNDQLNNNLNYQVRLTLGVPIFNRYSARNRVAHARIDYEFLRADSEQRQLQLQKTIYQAHADAQAYWQQYLSTEMSRIAFEEAFRFASQRFDQGIINAVEYNEARVRLARAQVESIQARYNYVLRVKILELYQGEALGF